jgi:hypothetical protein
MGMTRLERTLAAGAALAITVALGVPSTRAGAADADKELARVRGTVEYQLAPEPFREVVGEIVVPDDALAVTLADSRALLRLADSSEVDIGAKVRLRVGAFNAAAGKPTVLTLELGAIHFVVRHPVGGRSNYVFVTPTAQIAVRGTEGYLVTGPHGTDFYCADCAEGDVTVRVGDHSYPMTSGQQVIVVGGDPVSASTTVIKQPCINPAAIAVSDGKLGRTVPPAQWVDTTDSLSADPLAPPPQPSPRP